MRAIFIFINLAIFFLQGCASVEVAKEITKATKSVETSVKKIFKSQEDQKKEKNIAAEKEEIIQEQQILTETVAKQAKISKIKLLSKTLKELDNIIGQPDLIRKDGKTTIVRYDSDFCRLYVFMKSDINNSIVEYYEIRDTSGEIVDNKNNIELCINKIKKV